MIVCLEKESLLVIIGLVISMLIEFDPPLERISNPFRYNLVISIRAHLFF